MRFYMIKGMSPALDAGKPSKPPKPVPKPERLAAAKAVLEDCTNPKCPYRAKIEEWRKRKAKAQAKWRAGK
jgi:hypothetical protein